MPCKCTVCGVKQAAFGMPGGPRQWCGGCKADGARLIGGLCKTCGEKCASYGMPGGKKQWCGGCKAVGAQLLGAKMCETCSEKRASYGRDTTPRWCGGCKPDRAKLLGAKMCEKCSEKQATFGMPGGKTQWCGSCKQDGAMSKLKMCLTCGGKRAHFGLPDGKRQWCGACKPEGAVYLCGMCKVCSEKSATFGMPGGTRKWCLACKPAGAEDLANRRCGVCSVTVVKGAHTVCANCDTSGSRRSRVREKRVAKWLLDAGITWTAWDKQLPETACGRYRPDFVFESPSHVVVLEVDEFEHAQPGYECDNRRMLDVFSAYGGTPVVFLRYNPDAPTIGGEKRKFSTAKRKSVLLSELRAALEQPPRRALSIVRLFYSGDSLKLASHVDPYDGCFREV